MKSPGTQVIEGAFEGQPAIRQVNPETGLRASSAARGPYVGEYPGGWKPKGGQLFYLQGQGNLWQRLWTRCDCVERFVQVQRKGSDVKG